MSDRNRISHQAFLQEIINWEMTLNRELKRLKQMRNDPKLAQYRLKLNSIELLLTEMESQIIRYRKLRDIKTFSNDQILSEYNQLSKRFLILIQKIGVVSNDESQNTIILPQQEQSSQPLLKKTFLNETFTYKMSKQPQRKKPSKKQNSNTSFIKPRKQSLHSDPNPLNFHSNSNSQPPPLAVPLLPSSSPSSQKDLSDIRYQLSQIKSLMKQINNQIKYHSHEDIQRQLESQEQENKHTLYQMKRMKDDHGFILSRINAFQAEIVEEKRIQARMLKQFEGAASRLNRTDLSEDRNQNIDQDVSDWVKIRL